MTDIIITRKDHILRIQLNRPQKKNALTPAMYDPARSHRKRKRRHQHPRHHPHRQRRQLLRRQRPEHFSAGPRFAGGGSVHPGDRGGRSRRS